MISLLKHQGPLKCVKRLKRQLAEVSGARTNLPLDSRPPVSLLNLCSRLARQAVPSTARSHKKMAPIGRPGGFDREIRSSGRGREQKVVGRLLMIVVGLLP